MMQSIGTLAAGISVGSLVWVFLVQAPWLTSRLGRDRFVPLMMTILRPLVGGAGVASVVMLATSADVHHHVLAGVALALGTALGLVSSRALAAGGKSLKEKLGTDEAHSAARFVTDGGGEATRVWHRVLGLLAVALIATQVTWLVMPPEHHHEVAARFAASAETSAGIAKLRNVVRGAKERPPERGAALSSELAQTLGTIITTCRMTGEAHEALHAFLGPISAEIQTLGRTGDAASARASIERLDAMLAEWNQRFDDT